MSDIININGNNASQLLTQYIRLSDSPYAKVTLYGVATNNASYLDVMRHDLYFRKDLAENDEALDLLKRCIESSDSLAKTIHSCLRGKKIVPETVASDAVNYFYEECEKKFWKLCEICLVDGTMQSHYCNWCQSIGQFAQDAFSKALQNVNLRGKDLGRAAQQQKWLSVEIKKIKEDAQV